MERVLSMSERLQRLLDSAEKDVKVIIAEAEKRANDMISNAKVEAERRRNLAQRGRGVDELIQEAEEKAKKEAEKSLNDYKKKAEALKNVQNEKVNEAIALVLKEVLPK